MQEKLGEKLALLVINAIDFIEKSVERFKQKNFKYAVINFCNGIELFFKARLYYEHWALILQKPDDADINKFLIGDIKTISISDAIRRLRNINCEDFGKLKDLLEDLYKIRNKLVHFTDQNLLEPETLNNYASTLCKAWFYFYEKLNNDWLQYFKPYEEKIKQLNTILHQYQIFLNAKFEEIKPKLNDLKSQGMYISKCFVCGNKSVIGTNDPKNQYYFISECLTCGDITKGLQVNCPKCNELRYITHWDYTDCIKCNHKINIEDIKEYFINESIKNLDSKEKLDYEFPIFCKQCHLYGPTVFIIDDKLTCVHCFDRNDISNQDICEYCTSYFAGILEDSYFAGCPNCTGKFGEVICSDE